jgi:hypothetical protein
MVIYRHVAMDAGLLDNEWNWDTWANYMTAWCTSISSSFEVTFRIHFHSLGTLLVCNKERILKLINNSTWAVPDVGYLLSWLRSF